MPPPIRSRPIYKSQATRDFSPGPHPKDARRDWKPVLFTESTGRPSSLAPNIRSLSWSATGSLIATAISSNVRVWNPDRPNVRSSTEIKSAGTGGSGGSAGTVEKVVFCPTREELLATTGSDGGVRLWDVRVSTGAGSVAAGKGTKVGECKVGDAGLFLTWHPSGTSLLVGRRDDMVQNVDLRKMLPPEDSKWEMDTVDMAVAKDKGQLNAMAFSNSGREVFATTADGVVKILSWPDLSLLRELKGHTSSTYCVQHSPTGAYIAVGGGDSLITLWDTHDLYCAHAIASHTSSVRDLSFSFDGSYLSAGSLTDGKDGDKGLGIVHVDSGEEVVKVETTNPVACVAWHPTRYWVAYSGDPGGLKIVGAGSSV